jgi:hypothetical protein
MEAVVVALVALPVVVLGSPASVVVTPASVSTVDQFREASTNPDITRIDQLDSIDLVADDDTTKDCSACDAAGDDTYPERHPNGDTLVDGRGFTLTVLCDHDAVLDTFGTSNLTVQNITSNITSTHAGAPTRTVGGNGIAMQSSGGRVAVIDSTITGNWFLPGLCDCPWTSARRRCASPSVGASRPTTRAPRPAPRPAPPVIQPTFTP